MRLLLVFLLFAAPSLVAQPLSDAARVALVTIAPGDAVHARWGHTALRVEDPATGLDRLYNYGTFAFTETFVFTFAMGHLDYLLSVWPTARAYQGYVQLENRSIIEQTLRLTPAQARRVFTLLETNALPEHRTYRYDFLFDNCATRPRDVLEQALGDTLVPSRPRNVTYRALIAPFLREVPALGTGLDLLLGLPVDARATTRTATFLPDTLFAEIAAARVRTPEGFQSLVARTDTVYWAGEAVPPAGAFPWHALVLAALALAGLGASWRARGRAPGRLLRTADAVLFGTLGVVGLLVAFLWFVSAHHVTGPNLNLLWAWPTHLVAAALAARRSLPGWGRMYFRVTAGVTVATVAAWWLLPQVLPAAAWPVALLAAVRAWQRGRPHGV